MLIMVNPELSPAYPLRWLMNGLHCRINVQNDSKAPGAKMISPCKKGFRAKNSEALIILAERVGFEPTVRCRITGFQDQLLKPLGHLSIKRVLL